MPFQYDLKVYQGDTGEWTFTFWQDTYHNQPFDLSGADSWDSEIRLMPGGQIIATMLVTFEAPNLLRLVLDAVTSETLPLVVARYDIQGTWPDRVKTLVAGQVTVEPDITE